MNPVYLNANQIVALEKQAADLIWRYPVFAVSHNGWDRIFRVSLAGLIHFYENTHTGWQHVIDRHSYFSDELYFGKDSIGNPSKFSPGGVPGIDWVQVADEIFTQGAVSDKSHKDEEMFVKYIGQSASFPGSDGKPSNFNLVMYRGTKIVHSLYPQKHLIAGMPKPRMHDLRRAFKAVTAERNMTADWLVVRVPYVNEQLLERYIIIFKISLADGQGFAHLQVNRMDAVPLYSIFQLAPLNAHISREDVLRETIDFTRFVNTLGRFDDLSCLEDVIMQIEKEARAAQLY